MQIYRGFRGFPIAIFDCPRVVRLHNKDPHKMASKDFIQKWLFLPWERHIMKGTSYNEVSCPDMCAARDKAWPESTWTIWDVHPTSCNYYYPFLGGLQFWPTRHTLRVPAQFSTLVSWCSINCRVKAVKPPTGNHGHTNLSMHSFPWFYIHRR